MEYNILMSYWKKFHEDKAKSFKEVFKKSEKREKVLFCITLISAAVTIVTNTLWGFGFCKSIICGVLLFISLSVEFISVFMMGKYVKEKGIRQTKQTLNKIKCGYTEVHNWLKELGYSRKAEIAKFSSRCESVLEEWENEKKENVEHVEKVISLFYIPMLLAIISWILASNQELQDMGEYVLLVFLMTSAGVAIYLFIICVFNIVKNSHYSDARKMKCMIRDFHGVLDYCYDCENDGLEIVHLEEV